MSPWAALPWFQPPRETVTTLPMGTTTQVVGADPNRAALLLGSQSSGQILVGVTPGFTFQQGLTVGGNTSQALILTARDHGAWVQAAWYAQSSAGGAAYALELLMRDWPLEGASSQDVLSQQIAELSRLIKELIGAIRNP